MQTGRLPVDTAGIAGRIDGQLNRRKTSDMAMKPQSYEFITATATDESQVRRYVDRVRFHYFNPAGLYAKRLESDLAINAAVDTGRCKSGAVFAHGGLSTYQTDRMSKLAMRKHVSGIDYRVWRDGMERDIESARRFLSGVTAGPDKPEQIAERAERSRVREAWAWPIADGRILAKAFSPNNVMLVVWDRDSDGTFSISDIAEFSAPTMAREWFAEHGPKLPTDTRVDAAGNTTCHCKRLITIEAADWYKSPHVQR